MLLFRDYFQLSVTPDGKWRWRGGVVRCVSVKPWLCVIICDTSECVGKWIICKYDQVFSLNFRVCVSSFHCSLPSCVITDNLFLCSQFPDQDGDESCIGQDHCCMYVTDIDMNFIDDPSNLTSR